MSVLPQSEVTPELLKVIAARLRPVCPDIPDDEFQELVIDVARFRMKYDDSTKGLGAACAARE